MQGVLAGDWGGTPSKVHNTLQTQPDPNRRLAVQCPACGGVLSVVLSFPSR